MTDEISDSNETLAKINQKILSSDQAFVEVKLKDGTKVQTGTVATMLHNVNLYNLGYRGAVERELEASIPTLVKVGLFELFSPDEWLNGENKGRHFVGNLAKKYLSSK